MAASLVLLAGALLLAAGAGAQGVDQSSYARPGKVKSALKVSQKYGNFVPGGNGLTPDGKFADSMADIGDVDGDGISDLCVGARRDDGGFFDPSDPFFPYNSEFGAVFVLMMASDGSVKQTQKICGPTTNLTDIFGLTGNFTGNITFEDEFGRGVAGPGDIDGDGIPDIAVGAPGDDDGGRPSNKVNRGAVYVIFLNRDGTAKSHQKISFLDGDFGAANLQPEDRFGQSLGAAGDVDGDNVPDLLVSAPNDADGVNTSSTLPDRFDRIGALYVIRLRSNGKVKSFQKISAEQGGLNTTGMLEAGFGRSMTSLGDLDGDNTGDFAVGANRDNDGGFQVGAVYLLFMKPDATVKSQKKISAFSGNFQGIGLNNYSSFGVSVAALRPRGLDNGNVTDLVVGAEYLRDNNETNPSKGEPIGGAFVLNIDRNGDVVDWWLARESTGLTRGREDLGSALAVRPAAPGNGNDGYPVLYIGASADEDDANLTRTEEYGAFYSLLLAPPWTPPIVTTATTATTGAATSTTTSGAAASTTTTGTTVGNTEASKSSGAASDAGLIAAVIVLAAIIFILAIALVGLSVYWRNRVQAAEGEDKPLTEGNSGEQASSKEESAVSSASSEGELSASSLDTVEDTISSEDD